MIIFTFPVVLSSVERCPCTQWKLIVIHFHSGIFREETQILRSYWQLNHNSSIDQLTVYLVHWLSYVGFGFFYIAPRLVQWFPEYHATRRFFAVFVKAPQLSQFWARLIQSMPPPPNPIILSTTLILSPHIFLASPSGLSSSDFPLEYIEIE